MPSPMPELVSPTVSAIHNLYANPDRSWRGVWLETYRTFIERHFADERDSERTYLGLSIIGRECDAFLWFNFRWAFEPEKFDGRMKRLFETGHLEEARVVADLRAIGVTIYDVEPSTGRQIGVATCGGHVRGHLDGVIERGLPDARKTLHVFENKTHNAKSFAKVKEVGVKAAKPEHYAQMQTYMHLTGIDRAAYFATSKDTDTLEVQRVKHDPIASSRLLARGERIVYASNCPTKIAEPGVKSAWSCNYCPAVGVCHRDQWARRNCRTCLHSTPEPDGDGRWSCARHGRDLSKEDQRVGCGHHLYIPDLVPGQLIGSDQEREEVEYVLRDGKRWIDGAEAAK